MKVDVETYLRIFGAKEGICTCDNCLSELRIRPYSCPCGRPHCLGWQMVHDAFVRLSVAEGRIGAAEVRAYRKLLGKRYDTTPWIFSATTWRPAPSA